MRDPQLKPGQVWREGEKGGSNGKGCSFRVVVRLVEKAGGECWLAGRSTVSKGQTGMYLSTTRDSDTARNTKQQVRREPSRHVGIEMVEKRNRHGMTLSLQCHLACSTCDIGLFLLFLRPLSCVRAAYALQVLCRGPTRARVRTETSHGREVHGRRPQRRPVQARKPAAPAVPTEPTVPALLPDRASRIHGTYGRTRSRAHRNRFFDADYPSPLSSRVVVYSPLPVRHCRHVSSRRKRSSSSNRKQQ